MMSVRTVTLLVEKWGLRVQRHVRTTKERRELGRQGGGSWEGKETRRGRSWEGKERQELGR